MPTPAAIAGETGSRRLDNPYDELPYACFPVEWSAPERLALAAVLHGGPRLGVDRAYRVLELGCGNGANLLPLAAYRPQAEFVGLDNAASQVAIARERQSQLGLENIEFVRADFCRASEHLSGRFDFILAHGVFSWVPLATRDAILSELGLCAVPEGRAS